MPFDTFNNKDYDLVPKLQFFNPVPTLGLRNATSLP